MALRARRIPPDLAVDRFGVIRPELLDGAAKRANLGHAPDDGRPRGVRTLDGLKFHWLYLIPGRLILRNSGFLTMRLGGFFNGGATSMISPVAATLG